MKKQKLLTLIAVVIAVISLMAGSASAELIDGLVELWEFNNDYSAEVTADHAGTLTTSGTGSGTFVSGKFGQCVKLDSSAGNQAYIVIGGDENDFDFTGESMSVSLWYTTESLYVDYQTLVAKGEGGAWRLARRQGDDNLIQFAGPGSIIEPGNLSQQDGSWHHAVITVDATNDTTSLYIDGVLAGNGTGTIGDSSAAMQIGGNPGAAGRAWDGNFDDVAVWNRAISEDEVALIWNGGDGTSIKDFLLTGPEIIFPQDGEVVPAGDVTFEWINIDPNTAAQTYVDVWFGTDPNKVDGDYTKIVDGQSVNTATVPSVDLPPGVYYWQVDSYTYGKPTTAGGTVDYSTGDPCMIEGSVYTFTNDGPIESVYAGADMVTWSGEPVLLDPVIEDDGGSPVTYDWTINTPVGLSAVIDPGTDVASPVVTFTKYSYTNAGIVNPSFEDGTTGWTLTGTGNSITYGGGLYNGIKPDGNYVLYISPGNYAYQVLNEDVQDGATYTLTADVGYDTRWGESTIYRLQVLAGSGADAVLLAEDTAFINDPNAYYPSTVTYTVDSAVDADVIGLPLQLRLVCDAEANMNALYDNVQLTSNLEFNPTSLQVELTLTAKDENNPAVSDTMTIDVFNDSCTAAREGLGLDIPTDYNGDCLVESADLATMAAAWLNDTSATETVLAEPIPLIAGELGILDITGINPATGEQWKAGDKYRLAFVTSGTMESTDPSIATYDAFVQAAADAAGLGGATWKCIAATYDNASVGDYNAIRDYNVGRMETEVPTYLLDGTTKLWNAFLNGGIVNTFSLTETGTTFSSFVATGAGRLIGDPANDRIECGIATKTGANWWRDWNSLQTEPRPFYAVSEPLTVVVPVVDAGDNISTWLGKETQLAPMIDDPNDPTAAFEYNWTASPNDDPKIDVMISNPSIEAPTVTVTKVPYLKPFLPNGSFENVTAQGGQLIVSSRDYWGQYDRVAGDTSAANITARQYVPNSTYHFPEDENTPPDGDIIIRASSKTDVSRPDGPAILLEDVAYDPTATYELSVAVGHPHAVPDHTAYNDDTWRGYLVQLVVGGQVESTGSGADNIYGGTVVAEDANSITIPRREWRTSVVTLAPSPELAHLAGEPIQIRLLAQDDPDPLYASETKVFFDNAVLTINGGTGEMVTDPGMVNVTMKLTANKQGETKTYSDRVMIDVYEDACELVKALDPDSMSIADHNLDCVTNMADLAVLAEDWLLDYALIQAEPKPVE